MNDTIEITYEMDKRSYAALLRKRLFTSPRACRGFGLAALAGGLLYAGGQQFYGPLVGGVMMAVMLLRFWFAPSRWLDANPHLTERKTWAFSPERIAMQAVTVKSEVPWTYFISWLETPEYFTLDLTAEGFCSAVPKAAMTPEQQGLFREWAAAKLPKHPQRLKRQ